MNVVKLNGYAKLNLTLDVTGKEGEFHTLDSLAVTVDLCDRVVLKKRKDGLIFVTMHGMGSEGIPPEHNNALRAGEAFVKAFSTGGADITVYKNIPIGAGMGGSSADAAAVIAGMGRLYGVSDMGAMKALADTLGSDTGFQLAGGLARLRGRGEQISPLPFVKLHFLVLCPKEGVSSKEAFHAFDELALGGGSRTGEAVTLIGSNPPEAARRFGNALYPASKSLCPAVEEAYLAARSFSPLGAGMTGSGSASFALFETAELADWAKSRYAGALRALRVNSIDPKQNAVRHPFALGEGEGGVS